MKDNKTIFYEELSQDFEMPEYAEFSKAMDDPKRRKALYDKLLPDYDLPDFETFSNYLAAKPILTDGEAPVLANYDVSSLPEEAWMPKAGEPSKEESSWSYIAPNQGSEFTVAPFKADERSKQVAHKPFAEEHPMGMTLSNETQVPLKPQEKFTTTYEDALPKVDMEGAIASAKQTASEVGQIGQAIAERGKEPFARESNATDLNPYKTEEQKAQENYVNQGMAQASRELRPEIQIDMELEKINAELEELEKEYYSSDAYLQSRIVKSAIPGPAKAAWDEFAYASPRIIELQKRKTALLQAKEYRAIADEISANNKKYNAVGTFFANAGVGAGAYLTGKLNSANSAHRTDGILTDKLSLSNKIQNGEALSQSEQETMTIYALEDMMESKYGSAERNLGYIAGYGAPQMIEFMVELALSPGRSLAKAGMSAGEKLAAKTVSRLTKKYGASAVAKMLEKMGTYTLKQSGRILGATGNAMVATATTQADDLVRGTGERMAGRFVGERDAEGNLIGTSVVDTKNIGRAVYEQGATQTIENLSEAIFEGMGIGKGVSAMISKAGGKAAGTKLGGKILKGATYKTVSELMERTAAKDWYQATSKVMKAMHLGSFPEEVMEEYAAIPMKHWAGVSESGMTLGEELLSPETFYTTMAGLSLGMGGMTAVSVAPATISAGIDIYNSRKAHKALRKSDAVGASVFGAEWADIKSRVESIREEDFGIEMATLLEEYETEEQKSAIYDYMIRLQYDRGYNQMRRKAKEEQEGQEDAGQRMEEAYEEGYDMEDPQARNEVKSRLDEVTALYGETIEESIAKFGGAVEFLRNLEGKVSQETMDIVTEYINLKETVKGIQDSQEDNIEARIEAMHKDVANRTHKQSGAIVTTQLLDEQGNVMLDPNTGAPVSFYVVDADMAVDVAKGSVSAGEGSAILRDANGKLVMVDNKRLAQLTPVDAETVKAQNGATIRAEMEAEANAEAPVEGEEAIQVPTETSSVPTLEVLTRELVQTEFGKTALIHIDMMMEQGEDAETINQTIDNEYGSLAPKLKAYYQAKANAIAETAMAEQSIAQQEQEQIAAQEAEKESHIIRNKDNDLDVDAMIANGVTPEQMAEDLTAEFSNDDPGLALSTAQEYLAQVQEERAKTKSIITKNGSLRKKKQFWSNVVDILIPQQEETPVSETPVTEAPVAEAPQAEVPVEAQNANAKWQAAPKVYGRETTLRVKGMRLRGRYVVAPAGVATGSHTADFKDNPDFIHDEQGRSRNPRDYSQASNQATTQEIAGNFALQNMQIVSPDGIVYDGNGRQIAGDIAAQNGTDGAYLEDLMDRADEFGFTPEQIQGMEHPRVYFEVAPGQLDYSAQTFDKFNAPEMKAPSAVELGAAMGQVLSDETFNRLADTIKQSGGLSAVYKSKPLQEAIAYILRDASDVKDVTTATLPQYYNAETRTLTEAGRNLLEACLLGKIFANNPEVLALLPKLPNKVMNKVAQAMPELAANMQMGEYALKDELANALTLVYEASQAGTSVNDYATQQDWTKGGSATDIFGKTVVMLAKALNGEIEGAELADVVRAYNVKAVDVVTGQGSMFETPTREQMLQEVINYYMKGEVATQEEEVATEEEEVAPVTEEEAPQQDVAPVTEEEASQQEEEAPSAMPKTRAEKVNAMSDDEFSALLASNDLEAMRAYEQELHNMLGIDEAEEASKKKLRAKYAAINAEFGDFDNAPESVRNEFNKAAEEHEQKYSPAKVNDRWSKLRERIFEVEAEEAKTKAEAEKQAKEEYKKTAYNGFLAEKTPMGAAKADKALSKQYRVDGKVNTVAGFIEAWSKEGPMELRVRQNGNKSLYLVNGYDFGKTAYDYAQYLQSKAQQETVAEKTAPAEQKAESVSHEGLVEQNKQKLSFYANRDLNALIKQIKSAMPTLERRVERTEEGSEERQDAEAELKKWSAVLEAAESLLDEHKKGSWKNQFAVTLSESKELGIEEVKALFESLNGDKAVGELFDKVYAVAKTLGLKIKISDQLSTAQGNAGNDGIVKYAASLFYLPFPDQERASTLLHELIHTCTMYATGLHANRNNNRGLTSLYDGLPQQIKDACAELEEIYNNIKNDKRVAGEYGIKSVNEMVAELSNPVFREKMKEISLWGKIVGAIKRLFGFEALAPEDSEVSNALAEAERVLVKMLDNFDKPTYDAIRGKLQQTGRGRRNAVLGERLNAFARSAEEFEATQREAVENVGLVMPGLNEAELDIVDVPKHDFTGRGIDAIHKAEKWANENLIGEHIYREGAAEEFRYEVTEDAVGKFLSSSSTKGSDNLGVHLAVLKRLPQVINASIEAEIHPDYAKVNKTRSAENGVKDENMLVHRLYGAVRIDGKIYQAKTTIQEFKGKSNEAYDYKITEVKLIVSGSSTSDARTNPTSISAAKVLKDVEKSYDKGKKLLEESQKLDEISPETLERQGDGRYTDEELALINDPAARLYGESFRTKKQQKQYAERVRNHMRKKANELAEKLHLPVEIIESEEDMAKLQGKKAQAKGWYEVKSGKIVLVLSNNESVADIVETVLHEGVAHLGLRKLFGKQFNQFLDNVYNHAEQSIREKIDEIARKGKVSTRTATEEYLASLAETTDFENTNATWWHQIKKFFLDMLHTIGFDYKGGTISDSELRYILWRSHENLKDGRYADVFSVAKDIAVQNRLKAEEKQAKERRRILSLGKTDSNPLVADSVNEEGLVYNPKKGIRISPQEYAQVSAIIQTYPNKSERGHVFTANNYYLCTDIDEEGNFKVVAAMPIEGNEELINEIRGENKYIAFKPLSRTESTAGVISRLRRQGKRLGRNLSATERQAGADGRNDSVHLGQQANSGADQRPSDRNDGAVEEETLYRMGDANDPNETAQRIYNEEMLSARFLSKETLVDFLASVDALQNAIEKKSKEKILDFQNVYRRMLALSSKNAQELKLFEYTVMPKLTSAINKVLTEVIGKGVKKINWESPEALTLRRYAIVKHGIERNRDMAILAAIPRIAKDRYKAQFKTIDAQILAETDVDRANALREKRADMQKDPHKYGLESEQEIDDRLISAWYTKVRGVWDENLPWKEEQIKLDNSIKGVLGLNEKEIPAYGLTLTDEYSGIGATLINEGLLTLKETRKNPYAARAKAFEFVEDYESGLPQEAVNELWAGLHEVNQFSLDKQKKSGLVDQKYVDECNRRFKYYVPLRGFAEKTAQDVYEYMDSVRRDNNPVQSAKGRESEPGNPFASMMNVGFRSITAGNHNMAVQAFWYLANRPDVKGFLVPSRAWHLKGMNDEGRAYVAEKLRGLADTSGDDILPIIPENASPEEVQYIVEKFENAMRELRAEELAFQGRKSARQAYRTLNEGQKNEHRVKLYMNGETRYVTIVGNPRATQALNGEIRPDAHNWALSKRMNNFMASAFTSKNASFALANLVRDTQHAALRSFVTEDAKYLRKFAKHRATHANLALITSMLLKYQNSQGDTGRYDIGGTLDMSKENHRKFKDFMDQGGATGFTVVLQQEDALKKLTKMVESANGKDSKSALNLMGATFDAITVFSEAAELCNRYAAYLTSLEMGRSEQRAISDAKEITLNFNRKGAGWGTYYKGRAQQAGGGLLNEVKYGSINALAALSQAGKDNLVFWNATLQGIYQGWHMLKKHPVKTLIAVVGLPMATSAIFLPMLNAALCDDDDKYYDELPYYERQRNMCFYVGGRWIKIPLDPLTQKFWALGDVIGASFRGKHTIRFSEDILPHVLGIVSPVEINWGDETQSLAERGVQVASSFAPSALQPLLRVYANRDWKGKPLYNDSPYKKHLPSYRKGFKNDSPFLTEVSAWTNTLWNPDADTGKKGPLDFAPPGAIEELLAGYFGGYATAPLAMIDGLLFAKKGGVRTSNIPVVGRFVVDSSPGQINRTVLMNYNKDVKSFMDEVKQRESALKSDMEKAAKSTDDEAYAKAVASLRKLYGSDDYMKYDIMKNMADKVVQDHLKVFDVEDMPDNIIEVMKQSIALIHDDKAFEADEQ